MDMYSRDDTLDPAYFAKKFSKNSGTSDKEIEELKEKVEILEREVIRLEELINSKTDHREITQNDYDNLPSEEKLGETVYFIPHEN